MDIGKLGINPNYCDTAVNAGIRKPDTKPEPAGASQGGGINPNATDAELRKEGCGTSDIKEMKRAGKVQCETCASRKYVDGSDDPGVSFKTPTKLSPEQAASAVASHENEHVNRGAAKASKENRQSYSTVSIYTSVCPECGKSYVSGGETRTVSRKKAETQDFAGKFYENRVSKGVGTNLDKKIG